MMPSRRGLLLALGAVAIPFGFLTRAFYPQTPVPRRRPAPDDKNPEDANTPNIDPKTILEANQKDIKKNVEKLYQLASELKAEVDKTDAVKVLSVAMLKKAEEIEKLARGIRSRALG
jgi:hypothetical protein